MKAAAVNKKATHEYFIEETYEAGLVLKGTEIKSIRLGKVHLADSYVIVRQGVPYLINSHIAKNENSGTFNHDEKRDRKLLLHQKEITKLNQKVTREGYTIVGLKLYITHNLAKVLIGLAKGKKLYDKRQALKERDQKDYMNRLLKRN